ncbi:hypothetical protein BRADI_3g23251v3, partial [Brachypodium distachyon]
RTPGSKEGVEAPSVGGRQQRRVAKRSQAVRTPCSLRERHRRAAEMARASTAGRSEGSRAEARSEGGAGAMQRSWGAASGKVPGRRAAAGQPFSAPLCTQEKPASIPNPQANATNRRPGNRSSPTESIFPHPSPALRAVSPRPLASPPSFSQAAAASLSREPSPPPSSVEAASLIPASRRPGSGEIRPRQPVPLARLGTFSSAAPQQGSPSPRTLPPPNPQAILFSRSCWRRHTPCAPEPTPPRPPAPMLDGLLLPPLATIFVGFGSQGRGPSACSLTRSCPLSPPLSSTK